MLKPIAYPNTPRLKQWAKRDRYLIGVLLQEALILAILGFLPGFTISLGLYGLIAKATLLPVQMTLNRATLVLFLAVVMCVASGAITPGVIATLPKKGGHLVLLPTTTVLSQTSPYSQLPRASGSLLV